MKKQKIGLAIFWIAIIWAIVWGVIGSITVGPLVRNLTMAELDQTIWAARGPLMLLWGLGGVPLGALVAGIGALLYSGAKGSTIWKFGGGIFLAVLGSMALTSLVHIPALFGIGGTLIMFLFFGVLWFWADERKTLKGNHATAADLKLAGYVFMLMAAWFTCGIAGQHFGKAFEGQEPTNPIYIMAFFVLGWGFLYLGYYRAAKSK